MKIQRPVNYLQKVKLPLTAVVSIFHRISGIFMFIAIGFLLWMLELSLSSVDSFLKIVNDMHNVITKCVMWFIFTVFCYHTINGIRHMLLDFGLLKETLEIGKLSAYIAILLTIILSIIIGGLIW